MAATKGVLFMKAEIAATGSIMRNWAAATLRGLPNHSWARADIAPVSRKPATTTYRIPTVITPSLANPASASRGVSTPPTSNTVRPASITRSVASWVRARLPKIATMTAKVNQA